MTTYYIKSGIDGIICKPNSLLHSTKQKLGNGSVHSNFCTKSSEEKMMGHLLQSSDPHPLHVLSKTAGNFKTGYYAR